MEYFFQRCPENEQILEVLVEGSYEFNEMIQLMKRIANECARLAIDKVLVDLTELDDRVPDMDRFRLGEHSAKLRKSPIRVGIVDRLEKINHFFETVARNRGVQVDVGTNRNAVLETLTTAV